MRYYFTLKDGETFNDTDGSDLADLKAAEREASKIAAEWLRDNPDAFVDERQLQVQILDENRRPVGLVTLTLAPRGGVAR